MRSMAAGGGVVTSGIPVIDAELTTELVDRLVAMPTDPSPHTLAVVALSLRTATLSPADGLFSGAEGFYLTQSPHFAWSNPSIFSCGLSCWAMLCAFVTLHMCPIEFFLSNSCPLPNLIWLHVDPRLIGFKSFFGRYQFLGPKCSREICHDVPGVKEPMKLCNFHLSRAALVESGCARHWRPYIDPTAPSEKVVCVLNQTKGSLFFVFASFIHQSALFFFS